jgi:hypothetical protein
VTKALKFIFENAIGKALVVVIAAGALFGGWLLRHDAKVEARTENKIITQAKEAGKVANAKAREVRRAARQPGAAERLQRDACRDCR